MSRFSVTFYGHACLKVNSGNSSFLMDPWFSTKGAFYGSWFQFPQNSQFKNKALEGVSDICLSHDHTDHLDTDVLLPALTQTPSLKIHVAKFQTDWFIRRVHRLLPGFEDRIIQHEPFERVSIGVDGSFFFLPEDSPAQIDSAIVCQANGKALVNLNDARLNTRQLLKIKELVGTVDYLTLQASGASEYPVNYTYPDDEMTQLRLDKRKNKLAACERVIDLLEANSVLFFAGPPVFLDAGLSWLNQPQEHSVFPDQLEVLREFESQRPDIVRRSFFLMPGDNLDDLNLWSNARISEPRYFAYTRKSEYIKGYARRINREIFDHGEPISDDDMLTHLTGIAQKSAYMSGKIQGPIVFAVQDRDSEKAYTVDFRNSTAYIGDCPEYLYRITAPASLVSKVVDGTATWDEVFLSFRTTIEEANEYLPHLKLLLKYLDSQVFDLLEGYEDTLSGHDGKVPMMSVNVGGRSRRIQRHCPHAGTDLAHQSTLNDDATITCLAHRLRFDLTTGECLNARGYRLQMEEDTPALTEKV